MSLKPEPLIESVGLTQITPDQLAEIRSVPHFRNSHYREWNLNNLMLSYVEAYVRPLAALKPVNPGSVISDVGTGYGWLAFAFAMVTPGRIIALDFDAKRVDAARAIGDILGVNERIEWRVGSLGTLPIGNAEVDTACCLEVVEHVDRKRETIHDLSRTTRDLLLLTTPNGALPVVFHDTSLPFCHFLPPPWRDRYARAFGRQHRQESNLFWTPNRLNRALPEFERVSHFFQHRGYPEWKAATDILVRHPIGGYDRTPLTRQIYYRIAAAFGQNAHHLLPNLAAIWRRRVVTGQPA